MDTQINTSSVLTRPIVYLGFWNRGSRCCRAEDGGMGYSSLTEGVFLGGGCAPPRKKMFGNFFVLNSIF